MTPPEQEPTDEEIERAIRRQGEEDDADNRGDDRYTAEAHEALLQGMAERARRAREERDA